MLIFVVIHSTIQSKWFYEMEQYKEKINNENGKKETHIIKVYKKVWQIIWMAFDNGDG